MAVTQLTMLSPRNSSRSLWGEPKLRWVTACWSSRDGKTMADGLLQGVELHALRLVTSAVDALKSMSRLTLPNSGTLREYSTDMTIGRLPW